MFLGDFKQIHKPSTSIAFSEPDTFAHTILSYHSITILYLRSHFLAAFGGTMRALIITTSRIRYEY